MRRRSVGFMTLIVIGLAVFTLFQLIGINKPDSQKHDAVKLLHQVSVFQLELVNKQLHEALNAATTDELNMLKQTVYTAHYTHERLSMAVGQKELPPLQSVSDLLEYIMRLQIGGNRQLSDKELSVFHEVRDSFAELHGIYEALLSSKGEVITSQNRLLQRTEQAIGHIFEQKGFK